MNEWMNQSIIEFSTINIAVIHLSCLPAIQSAIIQPTTKPASNQLVNYPAF